MRECLCLCLCRSVLISLCLLFLQGKRVCALSAADMQKSSELIQSPAKKVIVDVRQHMTLSVRPVEVHVSAVQCSAVEVRR